MLSGFADDFRSRLHAQGACSSSTQRARARPSPYTVLGHTYQPLATAHGFRETGLASWYGPNFHGRRTANGETYDMEAMTAAHKTLPLNTWVKVTNTSNGKYRRGKGQRPRAFCRQ